MTRKPKLKPWFSLNEAADFLSKKLDCVCQNTDVINFALSGNLRLSWYLTNHLALPVEFSDTNGDTPSLSHLESRELNLLPSRFGPSLFNILGDAEYLSQGFEIVLDASPKLKEFLHEQIVGKSGVRYIGSGIPLRDSSNKLWLLAKNKVVLFPDEMELNSPGPSQLYDSRNEPPLLTELGIQGEHLSHFVQSSTGSSIESTAQREIKSLLKILFAVAKEKYNYDPDRSRQTAAKEIVDAVCRQGQSIKHDTVLRWLREAAQFNRENQKL